MYVISESKVPIKVWTQPESLEAEARAQLINVASLPFVFKHVAVMPDVHAGKGSTIGTVIATKGAIIPACVGVDIGCFRGDTRVPLLNGTQKTLKELFLSKKHFWVYSVDESLNIAPGKAVCLKTRKNAPLMRVVVSGGEEIFCTPDHEFMLNDGSYRTAEELKSNDSLMPLYRKWQTRDGYESVSNGKENTKQTHEMVWNYLNGNIRKSQVIHHINHKNFDNSPENLQVMGAREHSSYHKLKSRIFNNADPEFQKKRVEGCRRYAATPEGYKQRAETGYKNILKYMKGRPAHYKKSVVDNGKRGAKYLIKFNTSARICKECDTVLKNPAALKWHLNKEHSHNHKVISVEITKLKEDVYCLQVEKHHNFALSAGVFVHNCGMMAVKTNLPFPIVQDNIAKIRHSIERSIPVGFESNRRVTPSVENWEGWKTFGQTSSFSASGANIKKVESQLGSLGGGNHFIEICHDKDNAVWVMLHSGSRNIGKVLADYHINEAKALMDRMFIDLPDKDLAYLAENTKEFDNYISDLHWAQGYAFQNRIEMMSRICKDLSYAVNEQKPIERLFEVNCHHNYVSLEHHFGRNVLVTRKGAVRARTDDYGIIPGSMGTRSFIVRGLGNDDSFHSCSHGAGRRMSRTKARASFSVSDLMAQTKGVECRKDEDVIDEIPGAYKDIQTVMDNQADLVEIVYELKQIMCVKG